MKTDDLIQAIVADRDTHERFGTGALAGALGFGLAGSLILYFATLAPRDLPTALFEPRFDFKLIVALTLALAAVPVVARLARPDGRAGRATLAVLVAPVLLALGVLVELAVVDSSAWRSRLIGENAVACLLCIPLLSAPILASVILFLRRGAPIRPDLAGVFAGLLGGGLGAFLYASHCPDDSPLFVAAWYPVAILVVTVVGWGVARVFVRW